MIQFFASASPGAPLNSAVQNRPLRDCFCSKNNPIFPTHSSRNPTDQSLQKSAKTASVLSPARSNFLPQPAPASLSIGPSKSAT
jgi:hypothetical protein